MSEKFNSQEQEDRLREAFNRRATQGPRLAYRHPGVIEKVFSQMNIASAERSLDIGCGSGWATRRLAQLAPEGLAVGLDVANEMVALARRLSVEIENVMFVAGSAGEIPWQDDFFTLVVSVDSALFWPDPEATAREVKRVMAPGGRLCILNSHYGENPLRAHWQAVYEALYPPVHLKSETEWAEVFAAAGFESVTHQRITDETPVEADFEPSDFYPTPEAKLEYRRFGALFITANKPAAGLSEPGHAAEPSLRVFKQI